MGSVISPIAVFTICDLKFFEIIFSSTQPRSPPLKAVSEILRFIAVSSNPSVLILFFNSSSSDSKFPIVGGLIIISDNKYSSEYSFFHVGLISSQGVFSVASVT